MSYLISCVIELVNDFLVVCVKIIVTEPLERVTV